MRLSFCMIGLLCQFSLAEPYFIGTTGPFPVKRTICGSNDMLKMIDQNDDLRRMGTPIGIYKAKTGGGYAMCTGTLVSKDLFLTAKHCEEACSGISVTFGFLQRDRAETFPCKEIVESGNDSFNQDYLFIRLDGNPGAAWGWYDLSDRPLTKGQQLMMIHHPSATPMKVSLKECAFQRESSGLLEHRCDTESGSSGSAILLPDFEKPENTRVVGVHTLGGCNSSPSSTNSGPSIRYLATLSPLIRSLVK